MSSLQGQLLIATPSMDDPNFRQTVMLMVQHDADGALALVLNRQSNITIKQAWEQVGTSTCQCEGMLGIGGPCQGPIMALHTRKDVGEKQILPGVFLSVEEENVSWLMRRGAEQIKCYIGYAGWAPGQLDGEIQANGWLHGPADLDIIFGTTADDMWPRAVGRLGIGDPSRLSSAAGHA